MTTTLTATSELQLSDDIAEANAATSGSFVIDLGGDIVETGNLTAIDLQAGVSLIIDGSNGSGGYFTLDGNGSYNGISVDAGGAGSAVTIQNLKISNVPSAQQAAFASGTISGTVTLLSNATFDQTENVSFGSTGNPATVINQGIYDIDQFTAGADGPAINGVAASLFTNEGTLVKVSSFADFSGVSDIYIDVTDTGTISVEDGNSNLRFDGASNSFSGTYIGEGMVDYGDPTEFQTLGATSYCLVTLGNLDMANNACTTTWADVTQNGSVTTGDSTSISNYGDWTFTSDNGLTLERPQDADLPGVSNRFMMYKSGTLSKTGGTGTTVVGINFNMPGEADPSTLGGSIDIAIGTLAFNGFTNDFYSPISGNGTFSLGNGGTDGIESGTTIHTGGWTITDAGTHVTLNEALIYSGTFTEQSGATLTLTSSNFLTLSNATFDGTVTGGSGTKIVMASGGKLEIDDLASVVSGSQVQNFNAPIGGFAKGDTLRLEGFGNFATINGASGSYDSTSNTTMLTLTDNGSTVATLELAGGNYSKATTTPDPLISGAVDVQMACFCAGTLIRTERGDVAVETLAVGDRVVTASGAVRPISWIGHRHIDLARHPRPECVSPIRIRAHAFADAMPRRDLLLSPDHAVLCDNALIAVRPLVNGASIVREAGCRAVTYFHIELDAHDIMLAEDLPVESYLDTGNRWMFANAGVVKPLHADLANDTARRTAESCLPFVCDPARVEPVWQRLARRAGQLGLRLPPAAATTRDPALCLLADGRHILPICTTDGRYVFVLPSDHGALRLLSRSAVPGETTPWVDEWRRLGVMVRALMLRSASAVTRIPLDHPALQEGWWAPQWHAPTALYRWTNGNAVLPLPGGLGTPCLLEVDVADTVAYPLATELPGQRVAA